MKGENKKTTLADAPPRTKIPLSSRGNIGRLFHTPCANQPSSVWGPRTTVEAFKGEGNKCSFQRAIALFVIPQSGSIRA